MQWYEFLVALTRAMPTHAYFRGVAPCIMVQIYQLSEKSDAAFFKAPYKEYGVQRFLHNFGKFLPDVTVSQRKISLHDKISAN